MWDGQVEVFSVPQQPAGATHCYAWGYDEAGTTHFICVMGIPPIASPEDAVKAALVAETSRSTEA